jgi:5-methylcytosine-specific restriction endonuclease McrA
MSSLKRASIHRSRRLKVLERDRGVCRACGLDCLRLREVFNDGTPRLRMVLVHKYTIPEGRIAPHHPLWDMDHIVPLKDGGTYDMKNLQTLCVECHRKKDGSVASAGRDGRLYTQPIYLFRMENEPLRESLGARMEAS